MTPEWADWIKRQNRSVVDALGIALKKLMDETILPMQRRIEELEKQIEERKYCGVWKPGSFKCGNTVTFDGARWIAVSDTTASPGMDHAAWVLIEKTPRLPTQHNGHRPHPSVDRRPTT